MTNNPTELPGHLRADLPRQVEAALAEDVNGGDITALLIEREDRSRGHIITREPAILCGVPWAEEVFRQLGGDVKLRWHFADGDRITPGDVLCEIEGNTRQILTGERNALNFLQTLSGTATVARRYADIASRAGITVLDTRKTIPGLRTAQKYAVTCGGCRNHRFGLYDAFLIKENHILACGSITAAVEKARHIDAHKKVIVEVENPTELQEAVTCAPDQIMLDNFTPDQILAATQQAHGIPLEVSGNQDLDSLNSLGIPGLLVSSGAITKHVRAVDLSLRLEQR